MDEVHAGMNKFLERKHTFSEVAGDVKVKAPAKSTMKAEKKVVSRLDKFSKGKVSVKVPHLKKQPRATITIRHRDAQPYHSLYFKGSSRRVEINV